MNRIHNLDELRQAKWQLHVKLKRKEEDIEDKLNYMEEHAGKILLRSILPSFFTDMDRTDHTDRVNEMLHWVFPDFSAKAEHHKWLKSLPFILNIILKFFFRAK